MYQAGAVMSVALHDDIGIYRARMSERFFLDTMHMYWAHKNIYEDMDLYMFFAGFSFWDQVAAFFGECRSHLQGVRLIFKMQIW